MESLFEDFESGSKNACAAADVELGSGSWHFDEALLGSLSSDKKNGNRAARIRADGSISMNYDVDGATTVSFLHANFGSDTGANFKLQMSTDGGTTWTDVEPAMTSSSTLSEKTYTINETGSVRFKIVVSGTSGKRINIDDFTISN